MSLWVLGEQGTNPGGCRIILVKFPPVSKVSEEITFDFVIQNSWIPMGSQILSGGPGPNLYLFIFKIIWAQKEKKNPKLMYFVACG